MSQMEDNKPYKTSKPKKSMFLGCFGFCSTQENLLSSDKVKFAGGKKKRSSWFRGKKPVAKTVPVEISGVGVKDSGRTRQFPVTAGKGARVTVKGQTIHDNINKASTDKIQDIIIDNSKMLDSVRESTWQNGLYMSKSTTATTITIASSSNINIDNFNTRPQEVCRTTSAAATPVKRHKPPAAAITTTTGGRFKDAFIGNVDSIIGMSIVMVTLIIMLLWGKTCAIVCTSVWFYFLPQFRARNEEIVIAKIGRIAEQNGGSVGDDIVDVNSDECKKKVVLEGFLERKHRYVVGLL